MVRADVRGGDAERDELLVSHAVATAPHMVENDGDTDLVAFMFFGPDINGTPVIPRYPAA